MNYERKYKEAIESIKRIYNQADSYGRELMEKEFPDLTESKEEELTEFEKMLRYVLECYSGHEFASESEIETLKLNAKSLLDLAKKELQPEFDKEMDKMLAETDKVVYQKGREDALKDLPKWKKCVGSTGPFIDYNSKGEAYLYLNDYGIKISELEKLKEEE